MQMKVVLIGLAKLIIASNPLFKKLAQLFNPLFQLFYNPAY